MNVNVWIDILYTQVFHGNTDPNTIVTNALHPPIRARCIALMPHRFNNLPVLRFDLLGKNKRSKLSQIVRLLYNVFEFYV